MIKKILLNKLKHFIASLCSCLSPNSKIFGSPKGYYDDVDEYLKYNPNAGTKKLLLKEKKIQQLHIHKKYHVTLRDVRVNLNPWSFITADDKLLFKESSCYGPEPEEHWVFRTIKLPKAKKLNGKTLFLSSRTNYWHLLAEELCDLYLLFESGVKLSNFDQIIFEKPLSPACQTLHEIFGLDQVKQVSLQHNLHLECEELHFFTGTFYLSKHALRNVTKKILDYFGFSHETHKGKPKAIVVSRGSSTTRRWLNEDECMEVLNSLGFKLIDPSKMSLLEQIKTFSSADIILGPHGAGLTNLMFSCPGTKVIEIRSNEQGGEYSSATCYEELSGIMEMEHHIFQCPSIQRKDLKGRSIEDADLVPNPKQLKQFLCESILA